MFESCDREIFVLYKYLQAYSGAARLTGCATCGADHPIVAENSNESTLDHEHTETSDDTNEATNNGHKRIRLSRNDKNRVQVNYFFVLT